MSQSPLLRWGLSSILGTALCGLTIGAVLGIDWIWGVIDNPVLLTPFWPWRKGGISVFVAERMLAGAVLMIWGAGIGCARAWLSRSPWRFWALLFAVTVYAFWATCSLVLSIGAAC